MNDYTEKRSSFRILESLKLRWEVIPEIDFEDALRRARGAGSVGVTSLKARVMDIDARLDELLFAIGREAPSVKEALELMNQKLRIVMQTLPEFQHNANSLADTPAQECELSADSLVFRTDEHLPIDTKLKLRFFLISDNRYFETLASVYRMTEEADGDRKKYRVVALFEGMASAEREALFQHLFSMQSETLRLRRISADEQGTA
jgi:hypothetical protein